jgi:hypothetical protein
MNVLKAAPDEIEDVGEADKVLGEGEERGRGTELIEKLFK